MNKLSIRQIVEHGCLEQRIVLACARRAMSGEDQNRLAALIGQGPDWDRLYAAAVAHGMLPLTFRWLNRLPRPLVPPPALRRIGREFVVNDMRCRNLVDELLRLTSVFEAAGIDSVPYKGPALADEIFGDASLRQAGDLDILIRRGDAARAVQVVIAEGYQPHANLRGQVRFDLRTMYHFEFSHPARPPVELHWRFCDDVDFPVDWHALWSRLARRELAGRSIRVLQPEETLVVLCVHAAKDLWNRMILLADVGELIRNRPRLDWTRVLAGAMSADSRRMLTVGLLLARDMMDVPLPPIAAMECGRDLTARVLAGRIALRMMTGPARSAGPAERISFAMAVRHRTRDKHLYVANRARNMLTPDAMDRQWLALPRGLSFLYYAVRPVRRLVELVAMSLLKQ
ncbi:MAG: nucleotidyltransferase family protein [Gemmatimonadota bacterium]